MNHQHFVEEKLKRITSDYIYENVKNTPFILEVESNHFNREYDMIIKSNYMNVPVEIKFKEIIDKMFFRESITRYLGSAVMLMFFFEKRQEGYKMEWFVILNGSIYLGSPEALRKVVGNKIFKGERGYNKDSLNEFVQKMFSSMDGRLTSMKP